jgi:predicted RND superfamily exporter protein
MGYHASMPTKRSWFGGPWVMLAITILLFVLVALFVDLKPVVDENFFFSTSDPRVQQSKKVEQRFPAQPQLILAGSSRDTTSPRYLSRLQHLTQKIEAIDEVTSVKSLTAGPKSPADALASPFWRRLLVAKSQKSSNVIIFLENTDPEKPIKKIEAIVHEES